MKKIITLAAGLCAVALGASAQTDLVKSVERTLKSDPSAYPKQVALLAPAFENPETAESAYTYFVPGKGAFDFYDNQSVLVQMGRQIDKKAVGHALAEGYAYFMKALPLDSVADAKGKIKTKYSKDIVKTLVGHHADFNQAALMLWEVEDYNGAVESWNLYLTLPQNPDLVKGGMKAPADTLAAQITYNMGVGASLANDNEKALANYLKAINMGYTEKNAFDYAISAASQLNDLEKMSEVAQMAYPLYGSEDNRYIGYIINNLVDKKEFAQANSLIDNYIANDPGNSQLYFVKGVICSNENKTDEMMASYKKALELNPDNALALLQYGYQLYNQAATIDQEEGGGLSSAEYKAFRDSKVDPLYREAAIYLEKALNHDETKSDARMTLRSLYYNLKDNANYERIENLD